jgi:hypothetical protein
MKILLGMPLSSSLLDVLDTYAHADFHAHSIGQDRASDRELPEITRPSRLRLHATICENLPKALNSDIIL